MPAFFPVDGTYTRLTLPASGTVEHVLSGRQLYHSKWRVMNRGPLDVFFMFTAADSVAFPSDDPNGSGSFKIVSQEGLLAKKRFRQGRVAFRNTGSQEVTLELYAYEVASEG